MSRQNWEDHSVNTASSSRYDPTQTSLRGGGGGAISRPVTPATSLYSDYMPPQRNTAGATSHHKKKPPTNKNAAVTAQNLPHHKAGRVKVGIRIRPVFQEEIDNMRGPFTPIIAAQSALDAATGLGKVVLTVGAGKQREFKFDYAFGPKVTQDHVYDNVARPVVTDVLSGFNGTIFAYGQTGTGKTYTMGILEAVMDDHAGIIPRSMSHIFQHLNRQKQVESAVSMSFIQIYRENIQDLLSASIVNGQQGSLLVEENLAIREDPQKGFYVEGLQEYVVRSYEEAEALLNLGLENRAIASTLMNSTSSRSHTVITIIIEQKGNIPSTPDAHEDNSKAASNNNSNNNKFPSSYRVLRSKLLMVDLAGSERVRKTVSKGTRLDEAKSINTSLSALGNVIAALAESNMSHVPYRDSKLTKILHDSLGGTASTSLVATVGPVSSHYNETLSTLQFGSRCMAVKSTPVQHEEVDFAEMCARLQHQLSTVEGQMSAKLNEQSEKYENTIRKLREQAQANGGGGGRAHLSADLSAAASPPSGSLSAILSYLEGHSGWDDSQGLSWFKAASWVDAEGRPTEGTEASVLLAYCFDALKKMYKTTSALIEDSKLREKEQEDNLVKLLGEVAVKENKADLEATAMANCDPTRHLDSFNFVGSHLAQISKGNAFARIKEMYGLDGESVREREEEESKQNGSNVEGKVLKNIADYTSAKDLAKSIDFMTNKLGTNVDILYGNIDKKDLVLGNLKTDLMSQMAEKRSREEEVVNWSYILKYLLATTSKLRAQLAEEQKRYSSALHDNSPEQRFVTPGGKVLAGAERGTETGMRTGPPRDMLLVSRDEDDEEDEFRVPPRAPVQHGLSSSSSNNNNNNNINNSNSRSGASHSKQTRSSGPSFLGEEKGMGQHQHQQPRDAKQGHEKRSPGQDYHLRNIAAANNNITSGSGVREERKRLSQAGKLGPRLHTSRPAVSHNAATYSEIDQIGPPPPPPPGRYDDMNNSSTPYHRRSRSGGSSGDGDMYYDDDGNVSLNDSEAAGSFRSAATVNSIPPYPYPPSSSYQRKSSKPVMSQRDGRGSGGQHYPQEQHNQQHAQSVPSSTNFAQNVVHGLGVVGQEAEAAMTVIERVSQMTSADIARLDAETRQQVRQIRLELGIIDADDKLPRPPPAPRVSTTGNDYYRSSLPVGMYTPSSNITMSDDEDAFSQLDDEDEIWR